MEEGGVSERAEGVGGGRGAVGKVESEAWFGVADGTHPDPEGCGDEL